MSAIPQEIIENRPFLTKNIEENKKEFIDIKAYYKSLFFEIIRDTRKTVENQELKRIIKEKNQSKHYDLSKIDNYIEDIIDWQNETEILNEKTKKIVKKINPITNLEEKEIIEITNKQKIEEKWKNIASELSKIAYSINSLDETKNENDYIIVLNKLLWKREESIKDNNLMFSEEEFEFKNFEINKKMNEIRLKHSIEIDLNNKIIDENLLAWKNELIQENIQAQILTKSNWNWISLEKTKKRRIINYLEYCNKQNKYLDELIKWNKASEIQNARFLLNPLIEYFKNILKISTDTLWYDIKLTNLYETYLEKVKKMEIFIKYNNPINRKKIIPTTILSIFDKIEKETNYIKKSFS